MNTVYDFLWIAFGVLAVVAAIGFPYVYFTTKREARDRITEAGYTWVPWNPKYRKRWKNITLVDLTSPRNGFRGTYRGVAFTCVFFKEYGEPGGLWATILDLGSTFPDVSVIPHVSTTGSLETLGITSEANEDLRVEYEPFNRTFYVRSPDQRFANEILHPVLIEQLLHDPEKQWHIRDRELLTFHRVPERFPVNLDMVHEQLAFLLVILGSIPRYMWSERGLTPPSIIP